MIPPGGIHALVVTVLMVVLGITIVNAGRGELELAMNGAFLAAGISLVLATLPKPPKPPKA